MKQIHYIIITIVVLVIAGLVFFSMRSDNPKTENTAPIVTDTDTDTVVDTDIVTVVPRAYTMSEVKTHNKASSCYTVINNDVYDLTKWIDEHPGGDTAILSLCGIDGTSAFEGQHGGQAKQEMKLETMKIGWIEALPAVKG